MIKSWKKAVASSPKAIYRVCASLGGRRGWLYANTAWRLRGLLDQLLGGVGLRRGRRHPHELRVGDAVDFWRVEEVDVSRILRLRSEMRAPGVLWLQFQVKPYQTEETILTQTLFYAPRGLLGLLYWYLSYPLHALVFSGLIVKLAEQAEKSDEKNR